MSDIDFGPGIFYFVLVIGSITLLVRALIMKFSTRFLKGISVAGFKHALFAVFALYILEFLIQRSFLPYPFSIILFFFINALLLRYVVSRFPGVRITSFKTALILAMLFIVMDYILMPRLSSLLILY